MIDKLVSWLEGTVTGRWTTFVVAWAVISALLTGLTLAFEALWRRVWQLIN